LLGTSLSLNRSFLAMEVLGAVASGVTLAALFKCTFEALDLIHLYETQDADFKRLQLQYSLEKCRLYNWGVVMGLADDSKQNLLSDWHSKELVVETLRQVIALFSDAQVIRKKYGCDDTISSAAPSLPAPETSHGITSAFGHFKIQSSNSDEIMLRLKKTKWVIRDRKKFLVLVSEVRSLIDSLEKITNDLSTTARLEEFLRIRINGITNVDTLLGIASVWKDSHPRVASAASTKADSISMSSGKYEFISEWRASVDSETSGDTLIADIEDLTITELKQAIVSLSRMGGLLGTDTGHPGFVFGLINHGDNLHDDKSTLIINLNVSLISIFIIIARDLWISLSPA
jgi:hypothetical protein